jgi:GNAT superfamily N-acetyltransferase
MLFADGTLAARIDRAEAKLVADLARAAATDTVVRPFAGGLAICATRGSPVNKVIGVGFGEVFDERALEAIEEEWRGRGEPVRFELSALAEAQNGTVLTRRGYRLIGFEHEMGRSLDDVGEDFPPSLKLRRTRRSLGGSGSPAIEGLTIERVSDDLIPIWREVVVDGFFHLDGTGTGSEESFTRDALDQMMGDFAKAPGVDKFLVRIHGEPVGAASMRLDDGIAQLSGATTLPAFRKRGVQTALLRHRLRTARESACELAVVTTQPGSRSQANTQRQGFQLLYARAILVKD